MVSIQLYITFGYDEEAEVWGSAVEIERLFKLGEKTQIVLRENAEEEDEAISIIDCEVAHIDYTEDGEAMVFAYNDDPATEEMQRLLTAANWTKLEDEDADSIIEVLDYAPPVAALHDLLLVVGDYESVDEEGYPSNLQVWHRMIEPDDPSVPIFGEKFFSHVILANGETAESSEEEYDDEAEELSEEQLEMINDLLSENTELELVGDTPTGSEPIIHVDMGDIEPIDLEEPGSPEEGYPVLTFYTAKVGYGEASVGVWARAIEPYSELDMIADGWELLSRDALDLQEFRIKERIGLALNTFLTMVQDEKGNRYIERYEIVDPYMVTEEQFLLIPPALQEMSQGIKELSKDFENIDAFLNDWQQESDEEEKDK